MGNRLEFNEIIFFLLLSLISSLTKGGSPSLYPCAPDKWLQKQGVTCSNVQLPSGLCSSCYLNPPQSDGKFKDCSNIYNKNGACVTKMNSYVKANTCDKRRAAVMGKINSNTASWLDWASLDYFLYSVCEMCCDCIPIGATKGKDDGIWVTDRGNCPAHSYYDICAVLPGVKYFRRVGEPVNNAMESAPAICSELTKWFQSPFSNNWQTNPKTYISPALDKAHATLLNAIECSNTNTWGKCYDMEKKQNNLGTAGDFDGGGTVGEKGSGGSSGDGSDVGGVDSSSGTCQGQVQWTCLQSKTFGDKNCCQNPGCVCKKGPIVKEPQQGCYKYGGYKKPGVGYELSDCSGNIRWGCLDRLFDGPDCKWTCKKWGCRCFPFEPKALGPPNWCTQQAEKLGTGTKSGPSVYKERASCFPDSALVETRYGSVELARLRVGDVVMSRPGEYSPVYMFSHHDGGASTMMIHVTLASGRNVTLSPGHHIMTLIRGRSQDVPAFRLRKGLPLDTVTGRDKITKISKVRRTGLYNPHTISGTIVINGVVCSTYTQHVHQFTAHALLSPLRMLWRIGRLPVELVSSLFQYGSSGRIVIRYANKRKDESDSMSISSFDISRAPTCNRPR